MATVSFRLPDSGATGTFNSGLRTEVVATGTDGRASVWGMRWNKTPGPVEIQITATKEQARASVVSTIYLSDKTAPASGGQGEFKAAHHLHPWLWLAAAAAAGGGAGFALLHSQGAANSSSPVSGLSIGAPNITVGHP